MTTRRGGERGKAKHNRRSCYLAAGTQTGDRRSPLTSLGSVAANRCSDVFLPFHTFVFMFLCKDFLKLGKQCLLFVLLASLVKRGISYFS